MKKLVLVINRMSGNSQKVDIKKLQKNLSFSYEIVKTYTLSGKYDQYKIDKADVLAVCGGDGTLNHALKKIERHKNVELIYIPCGTLNESGKALSSQFSTKLLECGSLNGRRFSYVAATGIFTKIGYKTENATKKKLKFFAYWIEVLKSYKVERIKAKIEVDGKIFEDTYTLIMAIDSDRCFGFKFNDLYKPNDNKMHMLTVKSPKTRGLFGMIEVFFPLFRAFFVGFKNEVSGKVLRFEQFEIAKISFENNIKFCVDGECVNANETAEFGLNRLEKPIKILPLEEIL